MHDGDVLTLAHIRRVRELMNVCGQRIIHRGTNHDQSNLKYPEKDMFYQCFESFKKIQPNTPEYEKKLDKLSEAMKVHYAANSHHPEHYNNGVSGMDLFDLMEMFMDWKADSEQADEDDIYHIIRVNTIRFGLNPQLVDILINTAVRLGWKAKQQ